jgi:hypothetical protein
MPVNEASCRLLARVRGVRQNPQASSAGAPMRQRERPAILNESDDEYR